MALHKKSTACFCRSVVVQCNKYSVRIIKIMRKSTRSILQELNDLGVSKNTDLIIESRGSNLIQSAINLLTLIKENYDIETAAELERRFINAIRAGDGAKFKRGMQRIHESKANKE